MLLWFQDLFFFFCLFFFVLLDDVSYMKHSERAVRLREELLLGQSVLLVMSTIFVVSPCA